MSEPDAEGTTPLTLETRRPLGRRIQRALITALSRARRRPATRRGRLGSMAIVALAGLMITVSALASQGVDLRAARNNDLIDLVRVQAAENKTLTQRAAALQAEVDKLANQDAADPALAKQLEAAAVAAAASPVKGPAVRVTMTDAPLSVNPANVDPDLLVIHQQDIQLVVNVLWAAGAEAMTIQGQRVTSTTGVKCVGNSVVLHGVPYAPPYVIEAIGDTGAMLGAINTSEGVKIFKQYVEAYQLGWKQEKIGEVTMPAAAGSSPKFAKPPA